MTYILSFIVAFGVTAIAGQILIPILRRLKAGQSIREDGPTWHMSKQGTPTMGGLMFILGIGGRIVGLKDPPSRPAAQCPDDAADVSRPLQHGLDHVGDGGFAVGAGDADETQFFRWESIECSAQRRISLTGIRHDQLIF